MIIQTVYTGVQPGGRWETSPALKKAEKFVPKFSFKGYEILTNEL